MAKPLDDILKKQAREAAEAFGDRLIQTANDISVRHRPDLSRLGSDRYQAAIDAMVCKTALKAKKESLGQIDKADEWGLSLGYAAEKEPQIKNATEEPSTENTEENPPTVMPKDFGKNEIVLWAEGIILDAFLKNASLAPDNLVCAANALLPLYFRWYSVTKLPADRQEDFRQNVRFKIKLGTFVYKSAGQFRNFVFKIVRNTFIDEWRRWIKEVGTGSIGEEGTSDEYTSLSNPCLCPCYCCLHKTVNDAYFDAFEDCAYKVLEDLEDPEKSDTPKLFITWFEKRYLSSADNLENEDIVKQDWPNPKRRYGLTTISTAVSEVRRQFCTKFVQQAKDIEIEFIDDSSGFIRIVKKTLMEAVYFRMQHCSDEMDIPQDLAKNLAQEAGMLPADIQFGAGRKPMSKP